jgi:hypothetical protein
MKRRDFLRFGATGVASMAVVSAKGPAAEAQATATHNFRLFIRPASMLLIDGTESFMWAFGDEAHFAANSDYPAPGPTLRAREGDVVNIEIVNQSSVPHRFAITAVPGSDTGTIAPATAASVSFVAPQGGSYMYLDPGPGAPTTVPARTSTTTTAYITNPIHRLMGLYGAFIVEPANGRTPAWTDSQGRPRGGRMTPYSNPGRSPALSRFFDYLGMNGAGDRFKGKPWDPRDADPGTAARPREILWMFCQIDPALHEFARQSEASGTPYPLSPTEFQDRFLPRYFMINGHSGFEASHDLSVQPKGYLGEPMLIRCMNAGICEHSPHIHGNHVMELTYVRKGLGASALHSPGLILDLNAPQLLHTNIVERDVWTMPPLDRKDMLLPFERPPDIPDDTWQRIASDTNQEPVLEVPLRYPMHCHNELSQTAGGGSYPMGLVADWEMFIRPEDAQRWTS